MKTSLGKHCAVLHSGEVQRQASRAAVKKEPPEGDPRTARDGKIARKEKRMPNRKSSRVQGEQVASDWRWCPTTRPR